MITQVVFSQKIIIINSVQCLSDGIRFYLERKSANKPFRGLVFVKGQDQNPYCSKKFNESENSKQNNSLFFHIPLAHCDMNLEANVGFYKLFFLKRFFF